MNCRKHGNSSGGVDLHGNGGHNAPVQSEITLIKSTRGCCVRCSRQDDFTNGSAQREIKNKKKKVNIKRGGDWL